MSVAVTHCYALCQIDGGRCRSGLNRRVATGGEGENVVAGCCLYQMHCRARADRDALEDTLDDRLIVEIQQHVGWQGIRQA